MTVEQDPFGREYRAGRLSDEETAQRMLATAVDKVNDEGLRVSFDLLRFEDLIADAGVARSAVYRLWPTKNHFYADLLLELAGHQHPAVGAYDENTVSLAMRLALENLDRLETPAGRWWLAVELARQGAHQNFTALTASREWSVYITLTATLISLPETPLQADLHDALNRSERGFLTKMSVFYADMMTALGFRFRVDLGDATFETLAQLGGAIVEGLALNNAAMPELGAQRFKADPFSTGELAEWSLPALGFMSIVRLLVEEDPEQGGVWSRSKIQARHDQLIALKETLRYTRDEA